MPEESADQENQAPQQQVPEYNREMLMDMLPVYYRRLFPHQPFYRWLSYGLSKCTLPYLIIFLY